MDEPVIALWLVLVLVVSWALGMAVVAWVAHQRDRRGP